MRSSLKTQVPSKRAIVPRTHTPTGIHAILLVLTIRLLPCSVVYAYLEGYRISHTLAYTSFLTTFSRQREECQRRAMRLRKDLDEMFPKPPYWSCLPPLLSRASARKKHPRVCALVDVLSCALCGTFRGRRRNETRPGSFTTAATLS